MITEQQVNEAQTKHESLIRGFLFERGWEYDIRKMYPWTKWVNGTHSRAESFQQAFQWETEFLKPKK